MDGERRRQLPSWMMRSAATEQASISGTKGENKENGSVKPIEAQEKVQAIKQDKEVLLIENKSHLLKKCEARTRKRKLKKLDERQDEYFEVDEPCVLKPCKESRSKRILTKLDEEQVDFLQSGLEKKVDGTVRKRTRDNNPRKKHSKKSIEKFHSGTAESSPGEDELTVEDLVSIAEEYLKADMEKEIQKSKNLRSKAETKSIYRETSAIGLDKNLTSRTENNLVTDQPCTSDSSLIKPLSGDRSVSNLRIDNDSGRDMLELFLGPWLRKAEEMQQKTDVMTEKILIDCELSRRSQNDTVAEDAPVVKKKFSLKEKVGRLLD